MAARILDGRPVSERRRDALAAKVRILAGQGQVPCLAAITVAMDHGWMVYQRNQSAACERIGLRYRAEVLASGATQEDLIEAIEALNVDDAVHGIILQNPLPAGFDNFQAQARISPAKDVEGVNPANLGLVLAGKPALAPCTALAALAMAEEAIPDLKGVEAVVVGASTIVGKPLAQLLLAREATVRVCHIRTRDLAAHTRQAELLIVAVGKAGLIRPEHVRPGAVVVDVGINRVTGPDGKVQTVGDVDPRVAEIAGVLTPVPGGVGALTTTILLESTVAAAERLASAIPALDGAAIARLLGGLDLPGGTADRIATLLARHLVPAGVASTRSPLERRLAALDAGRGCLVLDGATGSELIARGVPCEAIARANREHPDLVLALHREYVEAGAQALTANTFSANRHRCASAEEAVALVTAGVRLARQAAGTRALVLASFGPLGPVVGAELTRAEAEAAFAELALAAADAHADGIILETMPSTAECVAALAACRRVCRLPVIACRAIGRVDQAELAEFARTMEENGAAAIGVNCAAGPRALVPVATALAAASRLPVAVRPNAGHPSREGGRWVYHLKPDWLLEQARACLASGVGILGGCCGVGPEHIRALAVLANSPIGPRCAPPPVADAQPSARPELHPLIAAARSGRFPLLASLPGRLPQPEAAAALARLATAGASAVGLLAGWPGSARGAQLAARLRHCADTCGCAAMLDLIAADTGLKEAQELLLSAHLLGLRLVQIDAGVFGGSGRLDAGAGSDPVELLRLVRSLNAGRGLDGARLDAPTAFTVGLRLRCEGFRVADCAGADFASLQPVYEPADFRRFMARWTLDLPLFPEALLLPDAATAEELDNELPALSVPERLKRRLEQDPAQDVAGVLRFLRHWRTRLGGLSLLLPDARTEQAEAVVRAVRA